MKFLISVSFILTVASASWEPVHENYHGPLHYPNINKGVPVEPTAVQEARKAHLISLSQATAGHKYIQNDQHKNEQKWHGPLHYPVIHNGVPVEPVEVQNARKSHLKALTQAFYNRNHYNYAHKNVYHQEHDNSYDEYVNNEEVHRYGDDYGNYKQHNDVYNHNQRNHYEIPKIGHDGKPLDTTEVAAAKFKHFAAVHDALTRNSHGSDHHYRNRRGAESYAHFSSIVDHAVPINYHHNEKIYYADDDHKYNGHKYDYNQINLDNSHGSSNNGVGHMGNSYEYTYKQSHSPVYVHHYSHNYHHHEIPEIGHDGTPLDTLEVQHAKAAHLAAHAAAKSRHY